MLKCVARPVDRHTLPAPARPADPKKTAAFANNYWGMEIEFPVAPVNLSR